MTYELACLCGCGHVVEEGSRRELGTRIMEHMDEAHGVPVDPVEAGELAIRKHDPDPVAPRRVRRDGMPG
jgi:hypothetical protein